MPSLHDLYACRCYLSCGRRKERRISKEDKGEEKEQRKLARVARGECAMRCNGRRSMQFFYIPFYCAQFQRNAPTGQVG